VALAANALTTAATVAGELGLTLDSGKQSAMERLIGVASSAIENYCRRQFGNAVLVGEGYVPRADSPRLVLKRTPVLSLQRIQIVPPLSTATLLVQGIDYILEDAAAGFVRSEMGWRAADYVPAGSCSQDGIPNTSPFSVFVDYTAGYVLPKDAMSAAAAWIVDHDYLQGATVANGGNWYSCKTGGHSALSGGPTGTGADITDGTAHWTYQGAGTGAVDQTLPPDLEQAAIDTVASLWRRRGVDERASGFDASGNWHESPDTWGIIPKTAIPLINRYARWV
jgi:hypothetical protein